MSSTARALLIPQVSVIKLTGDAPADFPKVWELQASVDGKRFVTILKVSSDGGLAVECANQLRHFRCDRPHTRSYEVRAPGDYLEYALVVHAVSNLGRGERNCLQLAEVAFIGPCASSSLLLHLDASSLTLPTGSLVSEWRDESGQ